MSSRILTKLAAAAGAFVLAAGLTSAVPTSAAQAAPGDLECDDSLIQKTLENGASWRMCARIHPVKGLVLEKVEFRAATGDREYEGYKRVLDQIYLAQLNVPYDNGTTFNDITGVGFGNQALVAQTPRLCPGEALDVTQAYLYAGQMIERTIPGICTQVVPTGTTTHSLENDLTRFVDQGAGLEVTSLSKIGWYEYQQKFTLDDLGKIDVGLGATGDLAPTGAFNSTDPASGWPIGPAADDPQRYSASHRHNAIYRVDFGIDEGEEQRVEQWDYTNQNPEIEWIINAIGVTKIEAFSSRPGTPGQDDFTWWRVLNPISLNNDGHPRSYEIVNKNHGDQYADFTKPTLSFTNDHACQEYASENLNPECPGQNVLDYVAAETDPLTDPIAWVNVGFHHIPRDEDQSPMPMHWQNFQLVPRDFFAQSPSTPEARSCINGTQVLDSNVSASPCRAVNTALPKVTANAAAIVPGTKLSATSGTWNTNRTTWDYSYLWFRDGQPITQPAPAIEPQYFVTAADVGRTITVKVTASRIGFTSGTAESAPLVIPGGSTPSPSPTTPAPGPVTSTSAGKLVKSKVTVKQNAKVRVTVKAAGVAPSGRIQIRHGSKVLKTAWVKNGKATITLPKLKKARAYRLRVVYLGTPTTKPSTSRPFTLRVAKK